MESTTNHVYSYLRRKGWDTITGYKPPNMFLYLSFKSKYVPQNTLQCKNNSLIDMQRLENLTNVYLLVKEDQINVNRHL